jgi:1-acyl-sn-glycerol-3-phosphate acyltransferase
MKSFFEGKGRKQEISLFLLEIVRKYFRLEVEGVENLPKKGRALIVPNHSGVTALDAVMVGNELHRAVKRVPRILAHPLWFVGPNIRILARRMGLEEANKDAGENLLRQGNCVMIFPEGAAGNFKPTAKRYQLQEFRRGFVRMAMATKAPIIPVVVIGAEETNINLSSIKLAKALKGTIIPIPLNVVPLPAKWKIIFLPKIDMSKYSKKDAANSELVHKVSEMVKAQIQDRINKELEKREWIYFPKA